MKLYSGTQAFGGDTASVDTAITNPLGTRAFDADGNEYVYLKGVGSTVVGAWVTFDEAHLTTLIAANAIGPVAVAMAVTIADTYGWDLVKGSTTTAKSGDTIVDNAFLYIDGAGVVSDDVTAGDLILGAVARSARSGAGSFTAQISYPFVTDSIGA